MSLAVMICVRGDNSTSIELLRSSYQDWKRETLNGPRWAFIGGIFRVIFGRLSLGSDALVPAMHDKKGRPILKQAFIIRDLTTSRMSQLKCCCALVIGMKNLSVVWEGWSRIISSRPCEVEADGHGNEFVSLRILPITPEMRSKNPTVTDEIDVLSTPPLAFFESPKDVKRSGFPEAVIGVFHLDHDVAKKPQLSHNVLQKFPQRNLLLYQSDFVTGDANSAANRFHVKQDLCHQRLSFFWYLLENNISLLNERIPEPFKRINAVLECSTRARDEYLSVQTHSDRRDGVEIAKDRVEQLDCVNTAVIAYGKYTGHKTARVKCSKFVASRFDDERQRPLNVVFPQTKWMNWR